MPVIFQMEQDLIKFHKYLQKATSSIVDKYFLMPVAGSDIPVYRERVYCYELYHQLRRLWPNWSYTLGGEVDKSGHLLVRGKTLDRAKPDFLIHVPGNMDNNLLVIEVKPITSSKKEIKKDLKKLTAFCQVAKTKRQKLSKPGYHKALYLFFGENDGKGESVLRLCKSILGESQSAIDSSKIDLYFHTETGKPAELISWPD